MKTFSQPGIFCLLILFSVTQNSIAQNESLRFEHIGIEEGLSHDYVQPYCRTAKDTFGLVQKMA